MSIQFPLRPVFLASSFLIALQADGLANAQGLGGGTAITPESILTIDNVTVDSYQAAASLVQNILPLVSQRGTGLDGSLRSDAPFGWTVNANPFAHEWNDHARYRNDIMLETGRYSPTEIDLELPAPGFSWTVGRTYSVNDAGLPSAGYQGDNWQQISQPEVVYAPAGGVNDRIYLVYGADRFVEFKRLDATSSVYRGVNGASGAIVSESSGDHDVLVYWDQHGMRSTFFDPRDYSNAISDDSGAHVGFGQLWKIVDAAGNAAFVGDEIDPAAAIAAGYDGEGQMLKAFDSAGRKYSYTYSLLSGSTMLTSVEAFIDDGASGWKTTGAKVEYTYHTGAHTDRGQAGYLRKATTTLPLPQFDSVSASGEVETYSSYYTYSEDTTTVSGREDLADRAVITGVVGPEGYRKFVEDFSTSAIDTVGINTLDDYMAYEFDYFDGAHSNNDRWDVAIRDARIGGHSDEIDFEYHEYETFMLAATSSQYDPEHASITSVYIQDGGVSFDMYFDEAGQPLTRLSTTVADNYAYEFVSRGELGITTSVDGMIEMIATPLACDYYSDPNPTGTSYVSPTTLRTKSVVQAESADGALIRTYPRKQSGAYTGFMVSRSWQAFDVPTSVIDGPHALEEFDYLTLIKDTAGTVDVGEDYLVARPLISARRTFNNYKIDSSTVLESDETSFAFEFHAEAINGGGTTSDVDPSWLAPRRVTTTYPIVSTVNNGSGIATTAEDYYRADDTMIFHRDETGIYFYTGLVNNKVIKEVDDVRMDNATHFVGGDAPGDYFDPIPITALNTEIQNSTSYTRDEAGRATTYTRPNGRVSDYRYEELADGQIARVSSKGRNGLDYLGPFEYLVWNDEGNVVVEASVAVVSTSTSVAGWIDSTQTDPILAASHGDLGSLKTVQYNKAGLVREGRRIYHDIPTSGVGVRQTNYDAEEFNFNASGQMIEQTSVSGTVRTMTRDSRGYVTERSIASYDPSPITLQVLSGSTDAGSSNTDANGEDMGGSCSCVTSEADNCLRITTGSSSSLGISDQQKQNDIFGRPVFVRNAEAPFYGIGYDNQGRVTSIAIYSDVLSEAGISLNTPRDEFDPDIFSGYHPADHNPDIAWTNRVAYISIEYNERGNAVSQTLHKLDFTNGQTVAGQAFVSSTTYDQMGREILKQGQSLVKYEYDRLGRNTAIYELSGMNDTVYGDAKNVNGDVVERETHHVISPATGQLMMEVVTDRTEVDYGPLEHRGQLDTNIYTSIAGTTVDPASLVGRAQITLIEYDTLDRMVKISSFGTGGTDVSTVFDPDAVSMPDALSTLYSYNNAGRLIEVIDPMGRVKTLAYSDAGQKLSIVENEVSPSTSSPDENRLTQWMYLNGQLSKHIAHDTTGVQTTLYSYAPGASSDDEFPSRDLLRSVTYPDGGIERYFYDETSSLDKRVDPAGNSIEYTYALPNRISRLDLSSVTGFDGSVAAMELDYSGLGRLAKVTQLDSGDGKIDSVSMDYDGWTNLESFTQDPDGPGAFDPKTLEYIWELANPASGRQSIRLAGMNLPSSSAPDGSNIDYIFETIAGSVGGSANMSRVSSITYDSVVVAEYEYMGVDHVAQTRYPTNSGYGVYSTLRDASGTFDALDDFNRPVRSRWNRERVTSPSSTEVPFYDISVLWDDNSNVTGVTDHVLPDYFNYEYSNDGLNRLTESKRGAGSGNSVTLPAVEVESWGLSKVGNWASHDLELTGDSPPDYSDTSNGEFKATGVFNLINEMTSLEQDTDNNGTIDITYSRSHNDRGDLTDDGENYKFVYDVLGRLVKIQNRVNDDLLSEYKYNGLGYRTGERIDTDEDGVLQVTETNWRYFIYDTQWRLVEVYEDTDDVKPLEVYVHHAAGLDGVGTGSYIDHIVLRDRDTDADGTLDEFHFYCQNWRADVVAIVDEAGKQIEQIRYSPYGVPIVIPFADQVEDGNLDFFDVSKFLDRQGSAVYEVRADSNLDGNLDFLDVSAFLTEFNASPIAGRGTQSNFDHRFGYAGYWYVAERGLYHVRNRWYNPEDGSWLTRDPAGFVDGSSLYQYLGGGAVGLVDPYGLGPIEWFNSLRKSIIREALIKKYGTLEKAKEKNNSRNDNNTNLPQNPRDARTQGFKKSSKDETAFHCKNNPNNVKYTHPDGREVVFDENGDPVDDPEDRPTYNYCPNSESPLDHTIEDILPWLLWGTGEDDPSTYKERMKMLDDATKKRIRDKIINYISPPKYMC